MDKPDFPLIWNDSLRSDWVSCPRAAYWGNFLDFKSPYPNVHLHAGKAWATALEVARMAFYGPDNLPQIDAQALGLQALIKEYGDFACPEFGSGSNKRLDRMMEAFAYYFQAFPFDKDPVQPMRKRDGSPMVEFNFALPIDAKNLLHPQTGEPILYAGRADMMATYAGSKSVYDDKTTSSLGASWGIQWQRRSQFSAYAWAAREYGMPISQIVVRGIAILKTSINHQQVITIRTDQHIEQWHKQVIRDIKHAIECWKEDYYDYNLSDSCGSYGGCHFLQPCMSHDPLPWLKGQFVRKHYDPITRTETLVEDDKPIIPIMPIE